MSHKWSPGKQHPLGAGVEIRGRLIKKETMERDKNESKTFDGLKTKSDASEWLISLMIFLMWQ